MLKLRKIFFYIFFLIYCLTCPAVILYALGYILAPGGEHGLVKAGLVNLATAPPGADVYVENRRFSEKTPTLIRGLLPGEYRVSLFLKGRRFWTRQVAVDAEKAVNFDKILLLPDTFRGRELLPDEFDDLFPVGSSRYLLLSRGRAHRDWLVYDLNDKTPLAKDVRAFEFFNKKLYLANEDACAGEKDPLGEKSFPFMRSGACFETRLFPGEKLFFLGRRGEILTNRPFFSFAGEEISGAEPDARTQKTLVWRDDLLGIVDGQSAGPRKIRWVATGVKISQAFWLHEGAYILFRDGVKVYLLDLSFGDEQAPPEKILEVKRGSSIFYSEKAGTLYFLEKNTGRFSAMEIVPGSGPAPAAGEELS